MATASLKSALVLGLEHNGMTMSTDEFDAVTEYDDLYKYELIHRVVVVNPIPLPQERGPNQEPGRQLLNYQESHPRGKALDDTLDVEYVRTAESRRRADQVIWAGLGRQPDSSIDVPAIVVEFVSAGRRSWKPDDLEKRDEYLALGMGEYWVISRFDRTLTVFRKKANRIAQHVVAEGVVYRTSLLPGFELNLSRLLAVADRWESHR